MCTCPRDYLTERCVDFQTWVCRGVVYQSVSGRTLAQEVRARHDFHNAHTTIPDPYGTNSRREPFDEDWEFDIAKSEQLSRMMTSSEGGVGSDDEKKRAMVRVYRGE